MIINQQIKRIIISRTDAIGDVILTLPVCGILKKQLPNIQIIFLGATYTKDIILSCSDVDEFVDWNKIKNLSQQEKIHFFKSLKADVIIHVFPNKEIAKISKLALIKQRIGTTNRWYHWIYCNCKVLLSRRKSNLHEAQLNIKLLKPLIENTYFPLNELMNYVHFEVPMEKSVMINKIDNTKFNLILHPKSKGSAREWGLNNFSQLIDLLPSDKFKIFICGTAAEAELMKHNLLLKKNENVENFCGKFTLQEYITFISIVDGLLAASTGPLHIASILGINTLGIYPPIPPMHPGRWSPIGRNNKIFVLNLKCDKCRKNKVQCTCIQEITPEEVAEYLISLTH